MSDSYNEQKIVEGLGEQFKIMENGFKLYASCRHTHPSMDCVHTLMNKHSIDSTEIEKILIETYQTVLDITDNPKPRSIYAAKFSVQFCVSLIALKGSAFLQDFNERTLNNSEIREMMNKVRVVSTKDFTDAYPEQWGAKVTIVLRNKESYRFATEFPKGDPENPASKKQMVEKFQSLVAHKITDVDHRVDDIYNIENVKIKDWLLVNSPIVNGNEA